MFVTVARPPQSGRTGALMGSHESDRCIAATGEPAEPDRFVAGVRKGDPATLLAMTQWY